MASLLKFIGGILITTLIVVFFLVRITFEILGASTAPDDFALLKQRMPDVLRWLFTTPWLVPTAIVLLLAVAAGWLLWTATKKTTADEIESHPQIDEEATREIVTERVGTLIGDLSARIDALDEPLVKLLEERQGVGGDPTPQSEAIDRLRTIADAYEAKERFQFLQERIAGLQSLMPEPPTDNPDRQGPAHAKAWRHYYIAFAVTEREFDAQFSSLRHLGFDVDAAAAVASETGRIIGDSAYLTILPTDAGLMWRTGEEKRAWYLREGALRMKMAHLRAQASALYEKSDVIRMLAHGS